jgi:hypothetical protein
MRSSQHYPEQNQGLTRPVVLFADGGVSAPISSGRDPFEALDDLMAVMDALCPEWPSRKSFGPMHNLRL